MSYSDVGLHDRMTNANKELAIALSDTLDELTERLEKKYNLTTQPLLVALSFALIENAAAAYAAGYGHSEEQSVEMRFALCRQLRDYTKEHPPTRGTPDYGDGTGRQEAKAGFNLREFLFDTDIVSRPPNSEQTSYHPDEEVFVEIHVRDNGERPTVAMFATVVHSFRLLGTDMAVAKVVRTCDAPFDPHRIVTDERFIGCSFLIECGKEGEEGHKEWAEKWGLVKNMHALSAADDYTRTFLATYSPTK
jgi:hypothetical protein